ncbi:Oidioi.mRNA.OKI2018_I69.PAR.g12979.t1.cds [Oikopleura dioica]|uniref:Oidioi.mRNA.OKI2018_I69.PAR.g12979.t1.cds n=1 Tax=Oikopleura dioica TaxID=34765 RepID=A0ABN7SAH9_OIKDI|nr:Oidioi.mRNA.OKI2018_I69.PAR.g12979.t1.cds [Oikopleura dioica]
MQDPNEDTEWNDILRRKGILPPKPVEPEIEDPDPEELEAKDYGTTVDDLDALLDDELDEDEEKIMQQMRESRIAALKLKASKDKFGEVKEITAQSWTQEVNQAGEDIWVIVHLYDKGVMLSNILNNHFVHLAQKYKHVKFVRGVAKQCVPNYPDKNLPTVFVYRNGTLAIQWIGGGNFGPEPKLEVVEWMLHEKTIIDSDLEEDPRKKTEDMSRFCSAKVIFIYLNYVGKGQNNE